MLLHELYGDNGIVAICFYLATLFRDIITDTTRSFPILNIYGKKGTGRTLVPDMKTKIETTNTGGKVLAYDSDELVGRLDFSFKGNVLSIDHTYAYKEGMRVGSLLVSAVNDYAVSKGLKVLPVCSFAAVWYQRHPQFQDILACKD